MKGVRTEYERRFGDGYQQGKIFERIRRVRNQNGFDQLGTIIRGDQGHMSIEPWFDSAFEEAFQWR